MQETRPRNRKIFLKNTSEHEKVSIRNLVEKLETALWAKRSLHIHAKSNVFSSIGYPGNKESNSSNKTFITNVEELSGVETLLIDVFLLEINQLRRVWKSIKVDSRCNVVCNFG